MEKTIVFEAGLNTRLLSEGKRIAIAFKDDIIKECFYDKDKICQHTSLQYDKPELELLLFLNQSSDGESDDSFSFKINVEGKGIIRWDVTYGRGGERIIFFDDKPVVAFIDENANPQNLEDSVENLWIYGARNLDGLRAGQSAKKIRIKNCPELNQLTCLEPCSNIGILELVGNERLTDLTFLELLRDIRVLELVGNERLTDVRAVGRSNTFERLSIHTCPVNLNGISDSVSVTNLSIGGIENKDLNFLYNLQNLIRVYLNLSKGFEDSRQIFARLQRLGWLSIINYDIRNVNFLSEVYTPSYVAIQCPYVEDVDGLRNLINIIKINLRKCINLQNINGLSGLITLRELLMPYCKSLRSIAALEGLPNLEKVDISGCYNIQDYEPVFRKLPNLKRFRLYNKGWRDYNIKVSKLD